MALEVLIVIVKADEVDQRRRRAGPGERRVPGVGDVVRHRLGTAHLLLGLATHLLGVVLQLLEVLALAALLGQPSLAPLLEVGRLRRPPPAPPPAAWPASRLPAR